MCNTLSGDMGPPVGDGNTHSLLLLYVALLMTMSRHDTIPRSLKAKRAWLLKLTTMKSML